MIKQIQFLSNRLRERLWVKPLFSCLISIIMVFIAKLADQTWLVEIAPEINPQSIERLLSILSSGMLVISTFAVASMIAAYASASNSATPRSFSLIISDDVSQNALSVFMGAFIFSLVAIITFENSYFDIAGHFVLFLMTLLVYILVILMFILWVDRIARLGRMGSTIEKIERATIDAMSKYTGRPALAGIPVDSADERGCPVYADTVGYVQHIDMKLLQEFAGRHQSVIHVNAVPGTFATPDRALAFIEGIPYKSEDGHLSEIRDAFVTGRKRVFDHDPRFGIIALSEIAGRALSPGINDPGTAINIIGTFVRLFCFWNQKADTSDLADVKFDRVKVPVISTKEMFNDAFNVLSRDGASTIEVAIRLQKCLKSLTALSDTSISEAAENTAKLAYERSRQSLEFKTDQELLDSVSQWHRQSGKNKSST